MHQLEKQMLRLVAQIPGVPDDIGDLVDTAGVTAWDGVWALLTFILAIILGRVARAMMRRYGKQAGLAPNIIDLLGTVVLWSIIALGTVGALTFVGLDIAPLWMLILLMIVVFVIGGRSLLEAFGAGVLLQARAPFEPGDFVILGDDSGVVIEVNSRVVVIDAIDGRRLFIPNTNVLNETIENLTHRKLRMSTLPIDVEYGTDLDQAIALAEASVEGEKLILPRPAPEALVTAFGSSSVQIAFRFWHEPTLMDEWVSIDAAARAVYKAYYDNGIVFAFPNATVWLRDNATKPPNDSTEQ